MSTLERAIVIAATAHAGQRDKAGAPYILHPLRVMLRTTSEPERIAAVLHDVVEDTPITLDSLRAFGFSADVLRAVELLTKTRDESYTEFVARVATDEVARRVKLADIADNMDLSRISTPTERDHARIARYRTASKYLEAVGRTRGDQGQISGRVQELMAPTIVPLKNDVTAEMVEAACPVTSARIYACDFYVQGIEAGKACVGGYRRGRIISIDHHAPTTEMARRVTSTMLALEAIRAGTVTDEVAYTVINHTDCDSMLSSALVMGLAPLTSPIYPDVRDALATASVNADHTGEEDRIADLLQGLDEQRHGDRTDAQYVESLRNLLLLLEGKPLEPAAERALRDRHTARARASQMVDSGCVSQRGRIAFGELSEELDGAFFVRRLPKAWVVMLSSPHPDFSGKWAVKLRLGNGAPAGFSLQSLGIDGFDPAYGGRWNAGSNKRGKGTTIMPEEYLATLTERVEQCVAALDLGTRPSEQRDRRC